MKRAREVAAAGGHNVIMTGPPGSGKTLIARALPGILPPLMLDEALDVTHIYSVAGTLPADTPMMCERPFRAPHHTISHAGLVGVERFRVPARFLWPIAVSCFLTSYRATLGSRPDPMARAHFISRP